MTLYDAFYRWSRDATSETHNWPTNKRGPDMAETLALSRARPRAPAHGVSMAKLFASGCGSRR